MRKAIFRLMHQFDVRIKILVLFSICVSIIFIVKNIDVPQHKISENITRAKFPAYIVQVYPNPGYNQTVLNMICATINLPAIWAQHDNLQKIEKKINESLQIKIDSNPVLRHTKDFFILGALITTSENIVQNPISTCEPVNLSVGQHDVSVSWVSTINKTYVYDWSFHTDVVQSIDPDEKNLSLLTEYDFWREKLIDN